MDMLCFQHFPCPFKDKSDPLMGPEIQTGFLLRLNPAVSLAKENILSQPSPAKVEIRNSTSDSQK